MSAWIVTNSHINALVKLALHGPSEAPWTPLKGTEDPQALGQRLWRENHRSINYSYGSKKRTPCFVWCPLARTPNPTEALGVVGCYDYQTCERPDYEQTEARALCEALLEAIKAQQGWTEEQAESTSRRDGTWAWNHPDGEGR